MRYSDWDTSIKNVAHCPKRFVSKMARGSVYS